MYIAQERICEGYDTYYDGIARSSNPKKLENTQALDDWEEGWWQIQIAMMVDILNFKCDGNKNVHSPSKFHYPLGEINITIN